MHIFSSNRVNRILKCDFGQCTAITFYITYFVNFSYQDNSPLFNVQSSLWARILIFEPKCKQQKYGSQPKNQFILFRSWIHVRKKCQSNYYKRRVQHLKESSLSEWQRETKRLSRITNFSGAKVTVRRLLCSRPSITRVSIGCVSDLSPTKAIGLFGRPNFRRPEVWLSRPHLEFLSPPTFDLSL